MDVKTLIKIAEEAINRINTVCINIHSKDCPYTNNKNCVLDDLDTRLKEWKVKNEQ